MNIIKLSEELRTNENILQFNVSEEEKETNKLKALNEQEQIILTRKNKLKEEVERCDIEHWQTFEDCERAKTGATCINEEILSTYDAEFELLGELLLT